MIQVATAHYRAISIARVSRVVADLDRAEAFYRDALGFRPVSRGIVDNRLLKAPGADAADEAVMHLGSQEIALVRFASPGRPYPPESRANDLWFQHLAIVVNDMDAAYAHLATQAGWRPISTAGPQTLPPSNGGVRAFKFRDPDGHPLELIWFPPGQGRPVWRARHAAGPFLGIDHSAIAAAATAPTLAFYRDLGFTVAARSLNRAPAQSRLDGVPCARVRVTGLRPEARDSMGLELLAYSPPGRTMETPAFNDTVTDWVTLTVSPPPAEPKAVRDPDGHLLVLTG